jgi:hypothetical protein
MTKQEFARQLSDHLYWDVDRATVDVDRHRRFMIPRIMDRGALADVTAAWAYYGEACVRDTLLSARSLSKKTIAFFANQFNLPRDRFRAFGNQAGAWDR